MRRVSVSQGPNDSHLSMTESNYHYYNNHDNQEDSTFSAISVTRDVFFGSRQNVNFVHEMYRQAFLLDFTHAGAIRKAIAAYKDWIQMNVRLYFLLSIIFSKIKNF